MKKGRSYCDITGKRREFLIKKKTNLLNFNKLVSSWVRAKGLEPPRLTAPDPKSGAATNYATRALLLVSECKGR